MKPTELEWEDVIQFEEVEGYWKSLWRNEDKHYLVLEEGTIASWLVVYELPNELFALLESGERTLREVYYRVKNDSWPPTEGERRECLEKYGEILDADRPLLLAYPRMSLHKRASQFSPFAALTGYAAAVSESARRTEQRPELSEDQKEELDREFRKLSAELDRGESPRITLRFFLPDERKAGGSTQFYRGGLSKIDRQKRLLRFSDGTEISIPEITALRLDQA